MPKLDHNLVFGESHDTPDIRIFLSQNMEDFYDRGYRVLACEINGALPVGDQVVPSLPEGSTLQEAVDYIFGLDNMPDELLKNVSETIPLLSAPGVERKQFGLLLRRALENKIRLCFLDYVEGEWEPGPARTKRYNDHVSPRLKELSEKWLELTGDDHVDSTKEAVGIVKQVGKNVVGFRFQTLKTALDNYTLTGIRDLEQIQSITNEDVLTEEKSGPEQPKEKLFDDQLTSLRAKLQALAEDEDDEELSAEDEVEGDSEE